MGLSFSSVAGESDAIEEKDLTQNPLTPEQFVKCLAAGDILVTDGYALSSLLVRVGTMRRWSHCGLVDSQTVADECGRRLGTVYYMFESIMAPDGCFDVLSQMVDKAGPRVVDLCERLKRHACTSGTLSADGLGYFVDVGVVKLWVHPNLRTKAIERLTEFENREHRKAYQHNQLSMVRTQYSDLLGTQANTTNEYMCSGLVSQAYKYMGLLDDKVEMNNQLVTPKMLCTYRNGRLPFREGVASLIPTLCIHRIYVLVDQAPVSYSKAKGT
jgi:hypothetical protein